MKPYTLRCENANMIQEMKNRNRNAARPIRWIGSIGLRQNGFTLVELLFTVAIIGVLAALLLPSIQSYFKRARGVGCMSSLRQIYVGATQFAADNQGAMPYSDKVVNEDGSVDWPANWCKKASEYAMGGAAGGTVMCPDGPKANGKQLSANWEPQTNYGVNASYLCYLDNKGVVSKAGGAQKTRLLRFYDIPASAVLYYDSGGSVVTWDNAKAPSPSWGYIPGYSKNKTIAVFYALNPKVTADAHAGRHGKTINFVRGDGSAGQATADNFVTDIQYW
jgi:prepilin-type N-terminal cleavage/methylation domain-containing protein